MTEDTKPSSVDEREAFEKLIYEYDRIAARSPIYGDEVSGDFVMIGADWKEISAVFHSLQGEIARLTEELALQDTANAILTERLELAEAKIEQSQRREIERLTAQLAEAKQRHYEECAKICDDVQAKSYLTVAMTCARHIRAAGKGDCDAK